jgi:hypothetical protein
MPCHGKLVCFKVKTFQLQIKFKDAVDGVHLEVLHFVHYALAI